jgi:hypothetical protein
VIEQVRVIDRQVGHHLLAMHDWIAALPQQGDQEPLCGGDGGDRVAGELVPYGRPLGGDPLASFRIERADAEQADDGNVWPHLSLRFRLAFRLLDTHYPAAGP